MYLATASTGLRTRIFWQMLLTSVSTGSANLQFFTNRLVNETRGEEFENLMLGREVFSFSRRSAE